MFHFEFVSIHKYYGNVIGHYILHYLVLRLSLLSYISCKPQIKTSLGKLHRVKHLRKTSGKVEQIKHVHV